jgi:hypothetical protein
LVHTIATAEIEAMMGTRGTSKKSWNNLRIYLHAFFEFCANDERRWVARNPVKAIRQHEIARGLPSIASVPVLKQMFTFLETYRGGPRSHQQPGYLLPYFALATFAGIRPSIRDGELRKIHELPDKSRNIDLARGVIRITPEIAKTNDLRQIQIQPNLAAWLGRYPLEQFPVMVANMDEHTGRIRKKFGLSADVLRHTFITNHVAQFQSLGGTALEAGNSESIIKKHYLNGVTKAEAEEFWRIAPTNLPA